MSFRPKQMARFGEFNLEEAVLDILLAAREFDGDGCLGAAEISKRSGIFRDRGDVNIMNDAIATGILVKLSDQNRVERCEQQGRRRGGWRISDAEYERRREDIEFG